MADLELAFRFDVRYLQRSQAAASLACRFRARYELQNNAILCRFIGEIGIKKHRKPLRTPMGL